MTQLSSTILQIEHLRKVYGPVRQPTVIALQKVSFALGAGEILALVGESGSGKSTIAKILSGIEAATDGSITLEGRPLATLPRQVIQLVFQDPYSALNPFNTVEYVVSRPLVNFGKLPPKEVQAEVRRLLSQVRLTPADLFLPKRPHELSGGQRQRVLIARALAARPEILVADEPVSMLDVSIRAEILALLDELRNSSAVRGMIYITHDMASARMISDRVVVLYRGKVVESGPVRSLFLDAGHPYTQLLLRVVPRVDEPLPEFHEPTAADLALNAAFSGCPFMSRCPIAIERCASQDPPLTVLDGEHAVACHRTGENGRTSANSIHPVWVAETSDSG